MLQVMECETKDELRVAKLRGRAVCSDAEAACKRASNKRFYTIKAGKTLNMSDPTEPERTLNM